MDTGHTSPPHIAEARRATLEVAEADRLRAEAIEYGTELTQRQIEDEFDGGATARGGEVGPAYYRGSTEGGERSVSGDEFWGVVP